MSVQSLHQAVGLRLEGCGGVVPETWQGVSGRLQGGSELIDIVRNPPAKPYVVGESNIGIKPAAYWRLLRFHFKNNIVIKTKILKSSIGLRFDDLILENSL